MGTGANDPDTLVRLLDNQVDSLFFLNEPQ
jgi:hypothetical protein